MSIVFTICETVRPHASSVADRVCQRLDRIELATTYTTRQPRSADDNGLVFTSQDTFEQMIRNEEFLEYVQVFGNYYGTLRNCLQKAQEDGKDLLIKVDERGAAQIKQELPDAVSILVLHSMSAQTVTGSTVSEHLLSQCLHQASQKQDSGTFDHVLSDDGVQETVNQLTAIIRSERARRS